MSKQFTALAAYKTVGLISAVACLFRLGSNANDDTRFASVSSCVVENDVKQSLNRVIEGSNHTIACRRLGSFVYPTLSVCLAYRAY